MRPYLYFLSMFHSLRLALKSIPAVGSSNTTSFELPMSAIATESFRLLPPERLQARVSLNSQRSTSAIS